MSLDLPTFTNGGVIVLGLLILALAAMLVPHPCPWRCPDCAARFPRLEQLLAHEARHRYPAYLPPLGTPAPLDPIIRQTPAEIAAVVARLTAGQRVRIVEDAPGWPLAEVVGRVVEGLSGTLSLDTWPWPVRLPSGQPGPAVVRIEVLS